MRSTQTLILAAVLAVASAAHARPDPNGADWWRHIEVLAADDMQGRLTGSPGYFKAADYVAGQFKAAGLAPGGEGGGYFQSVRLISQIVDQDASSVSLTVGGRDRPLRVGPDLLLGSRFEQPKAITAPLVFLGYGLALPEQGFDDFAGQDLRGKIGVVIAGGPDELSAALKAHSGAYARYQAIRKAGLVGLISIPNPKSMDIPWERVRLLAKQSGMVIADPASQDLTGPFFSASINPASAEALFAASGHHFADVLALSDAHKPIKGFPLGATLTAKVAAERSPVTSPNVVGVLEGSDPVLKGEYLVVSAHLDHLGVGAPIQGDPVYHGAMDNAAGVASLIETARTLSEGARPKRSILFVAVTGEEKGLLGSRYFAEHPTVPRSAVVGDINMDEFLPLYPLKHLTVFGETESTLGADAREVAKGFGYDTIPDRQPDRVLFVRSDQYSFIRTGVPAIALKFGFEPGSPEERLDKDWNTNRYHSPQDNLTQPVDKAAAAQFDVYLAALVRRVADEPSRPAWAPDSFFRRFAR